MLQWDEVVRRGRARHRHPVQRQRVHSEERQGCETEFLHFKQELSARFLADIAPTDISAPMLIYTR